MIFMLISAVVTIVAIVGLIWSHAKYPNNPYLTAAKEWQSLIGAFLGFLFLSGSVIASETYKSEIEKSVSIKKQNAYALILSAELANFRVDISNRAAVFEKQKFDVTDCILARQAMREIPVTNYSLQENFTDLIPEFSEDFNYIGASIFGARERYLDFTKLGGDRICLERPQVYRDTMRDYHAEADRLAKSQASELNRIIKETAG